MIGSVHLRDMHSTPSRDRNRTYGRLATLSSSAIITHLIYCGVDYTGPLLIHSASGRGHKSHKAYIALFVCMVTRAIHHELVSDCSTAAFLAAFNRFSAWHGLPSAMYSDNATNFRGAHRELALAWQATIKDRNLISKLSEKKHNLALPAPVRTALRRFVGSRSA